MEYIGRCMRCLRQMQMKECAAKEIKSGTWAVSGKCIKCGCNMFKIIGKVKPEC